MVIPIILVVAIPIFFGIVYSPPFDLPEEFNEELISEEPNEFDDEAIPEEPDMSILHFMLVIIWIVVLLRILLQVKKGTFKATQRY